MHYAITHSSQYPCMHISSLPDPHICQTVFHYLPLCQHGPLSWSDNVMDGAWNPSPQGLMGSLLESAKNSITCSSNFVSYCLSMSKFAPVAAARLSWQVPNYDIMWPDHSFSRHKFLRDLYHKLIKPIRNVSLVLFVRLLYTISGRHKAWSATAANMGDLSYLCEMDSAL